MKNDMPSITINVADLRDLTRSALGQGMSHLVMTTLPSRWDPLGRGWQEHWEEQQSAGFYASCDGIILLSTLASENFIDTAVAADVLDRVYHHHLCPFLDNKIVVDIDKKQARRRCLGTTIKLAKFVQASAKLPEGIRRNDLLMISKEILIDVASRADGLWSATVGANAPRLSATCEGLLALTESKDQEAAAVILSGQQTLLDLLPQDNIGAGWRVVILSTLVDVAVGLQQIPTPRLINEARQALSAINSLGPESVVEYFQTVKGDSDYYHLNVRLLGARAIITLFGLGLLSNEQLRLAIPIVHDTARNISLNGRYLAAAPATPPRFWEFFQAMRLLSEFNRLDLPKSRESTIMWISPKHFEAKNFEIDNELVMVLMPLTTDWSEDVFDALKKVKKVKDATYRYVRSDQRFRDEKIMQSIWEDINRARFVIADCTGRNPNVFYELGIAHTLGKPVFICAQDRNDIPFDLAAIRSYDYGSPRPGQLRTLQKNLTKFINDLE